jgi:CubicO group peptidase (beta-lactamase class C family)
VVAAGWGDKTEFVFAGGWAETGERERKMSEQTLFDLASLTKVVATLPVALRLLQDGRIDLGTKVADVVPGFVPTGRSSPARREVTVEHLLTHTSGLPPYRGYWRLGLSPAELAERLVREPLLLPPGAQVVYSDIGFYLLGRVCERAAGRTLPELVGNWVSGPLAMGKTSYGPRTERDVAATELGPDGRARVGTVHDETAAALGGVSGHAGLFSTASDLGTYLGAWLNGEGWLSKRWREEALSDKTAGLGGHRGLGWVGRGDAFDQLPDNWPPTAFSHTGFTGTSLALDPASGRWVVMLTNDVHFGRNRRRIRPLRQAVHRVLAP